MKTSHRLVTPALRSPWWHCAIALCVGAVAACGGGGGGGDGDGGGGGDRVDDGAARVANAPTADEVGSVVKAFLPHFAIGLPESKPQPPAASRPIAVDPSTSFSLSRPCPAGGIARVTGSYTVEPVTAGVAFIHEQRLEACAHGLGKGGEGVWKVDAVPGLRTTTTYRLQSDVFSFEMRVLGAATLSNGPRSQRCNWDLTVEGALGGPSVEMRARGRACGYSVDQPIVLAGLPG